MKSSYVIFKKDSFEILDADKTLYGFLETREYWPFVRLIMDAYLDQFYKALRKYLEDVDNNPTKDFVTHKFFIRLNDGVTGNHPYICWFSKSSAEDRLKLNLVEINSLFEEYESKSEQLKIDETVLALYNDIYFIYDAATDVIAFYNMTKVRQKVYEISLEKKIEELKSEVSAEYYCEINEFAQGLRSGEHQQYAVFPFDIEVPDNTAVFSFFQSAAIYENKEYVKSCGYYRRGTAGSFSMNKMIELDSLTGVLTKAEITAKAISLINMRKVKDTTICIVDVDYFKKVNDTFGHMKGDEILKGVAGIIEEAVGNDGVVGRIGGDEFMVIIYNAHDMENMREMLKSMKNHVSAAFPAEVETEPSVTLSIGCASYPKDADNYEDTFLLADLALYTAKEKGRDRYVIYDIAKHGGLEVAKNIKRNDRVEGRGDRPKGDILCDMMDRKLRGEDYPIQKLLDDFIVSFDVHRIMIYAGNPMRVTYMAGEGQPDLDVILKTQDYVNSAEYKSLMGEQSEILKNTVVSLENQYKELYSKMTLQQVSGFVHFKIKDKNGTNAIVSFESVKRMSWNKNNVYYYRLFARLLSEYELTQNAYL